MNGNGNRGRAPAGVVVVALGNGEVRALEASRHGSELEVRHWASAATERGESGTARKVTRVLAEAGIRERKVVLCLPAHAAVLKHVRLPPATPAQLPQLIAFEAQRYLPLPLDQLATGFVPAPPDPTTDGTDVLLAVTRRTDLARRCEELAAAGLAVTGCAVESLTVTDACLPLLPENRDRYSRLMLVAGDGCIHAQILRGTQLLFHRALPDRDGWEAELIRSLAAFRLEAAAPEIDEVVLIGPLEPALLKDALGVPVHRLPVHPAQSAGLDLPHEWIPLIGAARQSLGLGTYPLTIDHATGESRRGGATRLGALAAAGTAVLIVTGLIGLQLDRRKSEQDRRERAERLTREIERNRKALTGARAERDRLQERWALLSPGDSGGDAALETLRTVSALAPDGVWLTQVAYERGRPLELQGTSRDASRATRFLQVLEGSAGFGRVELNYLRSDTQQRQPVTRFRIECWRESQPSGDATRLAAREGGQ